MNAIAQVRGIIDTPILMDYRMAVPDAVQFIVSMRRHGPLEFSELSAMYVIVKCPTRPNSRH